MSRNLKTLVANPRSVDALTGAGRAALAVGDAQGALSFLARAEDESPRDGRIKMWIGSALVQLEQPHAALKFFKDAAELGVPESELARDRGLAYDIAGDQRRAQRDYRLALQRDRDPEVVRRLALSLAIGGDRTQALQLLDGQLADRSAAAERTRALVLALTGDVADAGRVVEASMPGPQGEALMPFLARLPGLSAADRALAVHLGRFPQGARSGPVQSYAANAFRDNVVAAPSEPSTDRALNAGRPDPRQPGLGRTTGAPVRAAPPEARRDSVRRVPTRIASSPSVGADRAPAVTAPPRSAPQPTIISLDQPLDIRRAGGAAAPAEEVAPPVAHPPAPRPSRLSDLAATVATLPSGPAAEDAPPGHDAFRAVAEQPVARAPLRTPDVPGPATSGPAKQAPVPKPQPKAASRHWVQIGVSEDTDALPGEFSRLKGKAGKLLASLNGWTAPMGATNRLLIGPFASSDDAQEFVNELADKRLRAFAWTSKAGEKVVKLPAK